MGAAHFVFLNIFEKKFLKIKGRSPFLIDISIRIFNQAATTKTKKNIPKQQLPLIRRRSATPSPQGEGYERG